MTGVETVAPVRFWGAGIRLFQVDLLVVYVSPRVIADWLEAPLLVAGFQARFRRTIVLAAQDRRGVPTYFGPAEIARVLAKIPFDALAWKRYRFSNPKPPMLPIPIDPPSSDSGDGDSGGSDKEPAFSYLRTAIRDRDQVQTRR